MWASSTPFMRPARLTSVISSMTRLPGLFRTSSAASALSHSITSYSLSSSSSAIISRWAGSSSTISAVARRGCDCPMHVLHEMYQSHLQRKSRAAGWFGSNVKKWQEFDPQLERADGTRQKGTRRDDDGNHES